MEHREGEEIAALINTDLAANPDFLFVLGTSLRIPGPRTLAFKFARTVRAWGGKVVYTNPSRPGQAWGRLIDHAFESHCDGWAVDLMMRLRVLQDNVVTPPRRGAYVASEQGTRSRGRGRKKRMRGARVCNETKQDGSAKYPFIIS